MIHGVEHNKQLPDPRYVRIILMNKQQNIQILQHLQSIQHPNLGSHLAKQVLVILIAQKQAILNIFQMLFRAQSIYKPIHCPLK